MGIVLFLDAWVFRFVSAAFTFITAVLAFCLDFDTEALRQTYPNWGGAVDIIDGVDFYFFLIVSALTAFVGAIYNSVRMGRISKLHSQLSVANSKLGGIAENIHGLFEALLVSLANDLSLSDTGTERVSIYVHRPNRSTFVPCGRFSHNPDLRKKGRTEFPDDQGCIGQAWAVGWHFSPIFPSSSGDKNYREFMLSKYGIARNTTRNLKMKPAQIAAKRISIGTTHIGVIVVESTKPDVLKEEELRTKLDRVAESYGSMIGSVNGYIPDPQRAKELGL